MLRNKLYTVLCLSILLLASCLGRPDTETADEDSIQAEIDSLSRSGKHGYHVARYILGRLRMTRVYELPFDISVDKMDEQLLGKAIEVRVIDSASYQLLYPQDEIKASANGKFDDTLSADMFRLLVSRGEILKDRRSLADDLKYISYRIKVYRY